MEPSDHNSRVQRIRVAIVDHVQTTLEKWTDTRHQIIHQGKKPTVRRPQARKCIELMKAIVEVVDGFALKKQKLAV